MALDETLVAALRDHLAHREVAEKRMFGGACFMWRGNLLCGVIGDELLVRLDRATSAGLVGEDGAHPMVMGGRTSQGWLLVPMPASGRAQLLSAWVERAVAFGRTLPEKSAHH